MTRRKFTTRFGSPLCGISLLVLAVAAVGCRREVHEAPMRYEDEASTAREPSDVPLRIVSTASAEFNDQLRTVWTAYSEQPIEITAADSDSLASAASAADVILFRNAEMGDLQSRDSLIPLPDPFLQSEAIDSDSFLSGLTSGSTEWGNAVYALPLGTALAVVWVSAEIDAPESLTWAQYSDLIGEVDAGQAAEPLAAGWAAEAFLNRAASIAGGAWLFDRNTMRPVLEDPPYVRALEQMVADRQRYPQSLLTPEQVWQRLASGELRVAIGWPAASESSPSGTVRMLPYPVGEEIYIDGWESPGLAPRPLTLSPHGLLVGIAASCRQTAAAREFLAWTVSGEGQGALRGAASAGGPSRGESSADDGASLALGTSSDPALAIYDDHVRDRLSGGQLRTTLRLPSGSEYLEALDRGVRAAIAGEAAPEEALASVAEEWESITERVGREQQANQWRQAQGLRGR